MSSTRLNVNVIRSFKTTGTLNIPVGATLYLNGSCGDVFVFISGFVALIPFRSVIPVLTHSYIPISGVMSTGANSNVVLRGGVTAASVFWVSETSLSTGVESTFAGIVLAFTTITIAGQVTGE